MAPSQPNRTESPAVMDRIAHDRARLAWVGEIHTDAMREFSALQAAGGGFDRPIADKCADLEKVVTRTAERAYQIADVHLTQLEIRESVVAAIAHTGKCNGMRPMSVLTIPPILANASFRMDDDDVNGDYEYYTDELLNDTWSVTSIPSLNLLVNRIIEDASEIGSNDYDVVVGVANYDASSGAYWNSTEGSTDTCIERQTCVEPTSIFRAQAGPWIYVLWVLIADVLACDAGMASARHGGHTSRSFLLAECAIWGVPASIAAAKY
jgi:hypothetical protein